MTLDEVIQKWVAAGVLELMTSTEDKKEYDVNLTHPRMTGKLVVVSDELAQNTTYEIGDSPVVPFHLKTLLYRDAELYDIVGDDFEDINSPEELDAWLAKNSGQDYDGRDDNERSFEENLNKLVDDLLED